MSQSDGLSALQGRRQAAAARRGRALPPPKHPRREPPAREPGGEDRAEVPTPEEPVTPAEPASPPARSAPPELGRGRRGGAGLRLGQFYLDPATDQWIRAVRMAAMQAGEDVTGSAVVRWAIARAASEVTPEQVLHELLAAPQHRAGPGRPRR
jgi:hypothetical protein